MPTILFSAPYMIPFLDRFRPVFTRFGIDLIVPEVEERLEEEGLMKYAGQFDGAICGDDQFSRRVIKSCLPRLKVISLIKMPVKNSGLWWETPPMLLPWQ